MNCDISTSLLWPHVVDMSASVLFWYVLYDTSCSYLLCCHADLTLPTNTDGAYTLAVGRDMKILR